MTESPRSQSLNATVIAFPPLSAVSGPRRPPSPPLATSIRRTRRPQRKRRWRRHLSSMGDSNEEGRSKANRPLFHLWRRGRRVRRATPLQRQSRPQRQSRGDNGTCRLWSDPSEISCGFPRRRGIEEGRLTAIRTGESFEYHSFVELTSKSPIHWLILSQSDIK